jgi:predicted O-methyltransferase YrrM
MTFTEEWFPTESQEVLADLVREVVGVDGLIVEIGAWEGRSTVALANAAFPRIVHSVDTWEGSPGEISAVLAAERDVHGTWAENVHQLTARNVEAHRMGWREYVPTITEPIALAFIDAEHTYTEVRDNVLALLPKMAPGGIICGDDQHHPPVRQALQELFPDEVMVKATVWVYRVPIDKLSRLYAEQCRTPSDIYLHLPRMVAMVQETNAQHVIELGTRTGVSTLAWLHALRRTGGRLTSVDIDTVPPIGQYDHWTFIQGDDCDPDLFASLEPADIVFIDTSHHYDHTVRELALYRWLVKPGGLMVLHDTELPIPEGAPPRPLYPVKTAVQEFATAQGFEWINFPDCWGLAVIKVV